jgi:hypothetical protein
MSTQKLSYYFTHNPYRVENLIRILEDGYIRKGNTLPSNFRTFGGNRPLSKIYCNIFFDDLQEFQSYWGPLLIIRPSIVKHFNITFHDSWFPIRGKKLNINIDDSKKVFWKKINFIHDYLKNAKIDPKINDNPKKNTVVLHEITFNKKISVEKYVCAIVCDYCTDDEIKKINDVILRKKYDIQIIRSIDEKK